MQNAIRQNAECNSSRVNYIPHFRIREQVLDFRDGGGRRVALARGGVALARGGGYEGSDGWFQIKVFKANRRWSRQTRNGKPPGAVAQVVLESLSHNGKPPLSRF